MHEHSIYEWIRPEFRTGVSRELINLDDVGFNGVVEWCKAYVSDPPTNDTSNLLVRWCIGQYQLCYVDLCLKSKCFNENEYTFALASAMLHYIMAYESVEGYKDYVVLYNLFASNTYIGGDKREILGEILLDNTYVIRQLVYIVMDRKTRYNRDIFTKYYTSVLGRLFTMFGSYGWLDAFCNAIGQLNDVELRKH